LNLATAQQAPPKDAIEIVLTPSMSQYRQMGEDIEALRRQLDLPSSASNTEVIVKALHRQATRK
jgi:hypothetical protein